MQRDAWTEQDSRPTPCKGVHGQKPQTHPCKGCMSSSRRPQTHPMEGGAWPEQGVPRLTPCIGVHGRTRSPRDPPMQGVHEQIQKTPDPPYVRRCMARTRSAKTHPMQGGEWTEEKEAPRSPFKECMARTRSPQRPTPCKGRTKRPQIHPMEVCMGKTRSPIPTPPKEAHAEDGGGEKVEPSVCTSPSLVMHCFIIIFITLFLTPRPACNLGKRCFANGALPPSNGVSHTSLGACIWEGERKKGQQDALLADGASHVVIH